MHYNTSWVNFPNLPAQNHKICVIMTSRQTIHKFLCWYGIIGKLTAVQVGCRLSFRQLSNGTKMDPVQWTSKGILDVWVSVQTCSWATQMAAKYWGHLDTAKAQKGGWVREDLVAPCHWTTMGSVSVSSGKQ